MLEGGKIHPILLIAGYPLAGQGFVLDSTPVDREPRR